MSPKTGRPPIGDSSKDKQYRLRMSNEEIEMLDYCCKVYGISKAEVIRQGIKYLYDKTHKKE